MSKLRLLAMLATALAATLVLATCGGDDDGADSEDEAAVTETIEGATASTDPSECSDLLTQSFVEQTQFSEGEEAVAACEEDAGDALADSVEVSAVEVEGGSATAEAALTGGGLNGQTLSLELIREGDRWKLDRIEEFVDFDHAAFAEGISTEASADGESSQELIDCVTQTAQDADPQELQDAYLSGEENELLSIFGSCFGGE